MSKKEDRSMNNDTTLATSPDQPGFVRELWQQVRLLYKLF